MNAQNRVRLCPKGHLKTNPYHDGCRTCAIENGKSRGKAARVRFCSKGHVLPVSIPPAEYCRFRCDAVDQGDEVAEVRHLEAVPSEELVEETIEERARKWSGR